MAVVAAGDASSGRFVLEDLIAAGRVIDALAEVGIDYCSPEAAVAVAAFSGIRHALGPLVLASVSGRLLAATGQTDAARAATKLNAESDIRTFRAR